MWPAHGQDGRDSFGSSTAHRPGSVPLSVRVAATVAAPGVVRQQVRRWLADQHWPAESAADCVLAVSEAVTNSVQHGYGITAHRDFAPAGAVTVDGHVTRTDDEYRAVFEVRDQGRWRTPEPAVGQRYGSSIMRGCMEDVHVTGSEHGTTVLLRSRPVTPLINGSRPVNS